MMDDEVMIRLGKIEIGIIGVIRKELKEIERDNSFLIGIYWDD